MDRKCNNLFEKMSVSPTSYSKLIITSYRFNLLALYDIATKGITFNLNFEDRLSNISVSTSQNLAVFVERYKIHTFNPITNEVRYNCGQLPNDLWDFQMCSFYDSIFVIGGTLKTQSQADVFKSCGDFTKWERMTPMKVARCDFALVVFENFIYVFGGKKEETISDCAKYDILNNKWIDITPLPSERTAAAAVVLKGEIYLVGGTDDTDTSTSDVFIYNPETNSWRTGPTLFEARHAFSLINLNDSLYAIGGKQEYQRLHTYEVMQDDKWVAYNESPFFHLLDEVRCSLI